MVGETSVIRIGKLDISFVLILEKSSAEVLENNVKKQYGKI